MAKENTFNIVVMGLYECGKSCLIKQFSTSTFKEEYDPTMEDLIVTPADLSGTIVKLNVYDSSGNEDYVDLQLGHIAKADGFLVVYEYGNEKSVRYVKDCVKRIKENCCEIVPIVVVCNKIDAQSEKEMSDEFKEMHEGIASLLNDISDEMCGNTDLMNFYAKMLNPNSNDKSLNSKFLEPKARDEPKKKKKMDFLKRASQMFTKKKSQAKAEANSRMSLSCPVSDRAALRKSTSLKRESRNDSAFNSVHFDASDLKQIQNMWIFQCQWEVSAKTSKDVENSFLSLAFQVHLLKKMKSDNSNLEKVYNQNKIFEDILEKKILG